MHRTPGEANGCAAPAVLVVDDDALVRESLVELISDSRRLVLPAKDGAEAIGILSQRPDVRVMVTDMMMPGMDGPALAQAARRLQPGLQVLFLSGLQQPPVGEEFLRKPVRATDLLAAVDRLMASARRLISESHRSHPLAPTKQMA